MLYWPSSPKRLFTAARAALLAAIFALLAAILLLLLMRPCCFQSLVAGQPALGLLLQFSLFCSLLLLRLRSTAAWAAWCPWRLEVFAVEPDPVGHQLVLGVVRSLHFTRQPGHQRSHRHLFLAGLERALALARRSCLFNTHDHVPRVRLQRHRAAAARDDDALDLRDCAMAAVAASDHQRDYRDQNAFRTCTPPLVHNSSTLLLEYGCTSCS